MSPLSIWTIYDHPTDQPQHFVARRWEVVRGTPNPIATTDMKLFDTLRDARAYLDGMHLTVLPRDESDDEKIVESWI